MNKTVFISMAVSELKAIVVDSVNACLKHAPQLQEKQLGNELIARADVKEKYGISSTTLWRWEKQHRISSLGIGGKRWYNVSELEAAMQHKKG